MAKLKQLIRRLGRWLGFEGVLTEPPAESLAVKMRLKITPVAGVGGWVAEVTGIPISVSYGKSEEGAVKLATARALEEMARALREHGTLEAVQQDSVKGFS